MDSNKMVRELVTPLARLAGKDPDDKDCLGAALELFMAATFSRHLDFPNEQHCTPQTARKELEVLLYLCSELDKHICNLHLTSLTAMEKAVAGDENWKRFNGGKWTDPRSALIALRSVAAVASRAVTHVSEPTVEDSRATDPKRKKNSLAVAVAAAKVFERMTGKRATVPKKDGKAYGPFYDLLKETFSVLGLKASAENMGREAIKIMELSRPN